jgi:hypothetical protein
MCILLVRRRTLLLSMLLAIERQMTAARSMDSGVPNANRKNRI